MLSLLQSSTQLQENKTKENKQNEELKTCKRELSRLQSKIQRMENETESLTKSKKELQEENNNITIKMNWAQNRLKTELETHVTCKSELENTHRKLKQVTEEKEQIHSEFKNIILQYQNSGEVASLADDEGKGGAVSLQKEVIDGLKGELDSCKGELREACERENELRDQVVKLGDERLHFIKQTEKVTYQIILMRPYIPYNHSNLYNVDKVSITLCINVTDYIMLYIRDITFSLMTLLCP